MNINPIRGLHKTVTFTETSNHFLLHSEPENIERIKWEHLLALAKDKEKTNITKDIAYLKEFIIDYEKETEHSSFTGLIKKSIHNKDTLKKKRYLKFF